MQNSQFKYISRMDGYPFCCSHDVFPKFHPKSVLVTNTKNSRKENHITSSHFQFPCCTNSVDEWITSYSSKISKPLAMHGRSKHTNIQLQNHYWITTSPSETLLCFRDLNMKLKIQKPVDSWEQIMHSAHTNTPIFPIKCVCSKTQVKGYERACLTDLGSV